MASLQVKLHPMPEKGCEIPPFCLVDRSLPHHPGGTITTVDHRPTISPRSLRACTATSKRRHVGEGSGGPRRLTLRAHRDLLGGRARRHRETPREEPDDLDVGSAGHVERVGAEPEAAVLAGARGVPVGVCDVPGAGNGSGAGSNAGSTVPVPPNA